VPEPYAGVLGDPLAFAIRSPRHHVVAGAQEFLPINWVGRVVMGVDAVDPAHLRRLPRLPELYTRASRCNRLPL
jgi:hypothetical protein